MARFHYSRNGEVKRSGAGGLGERAASPVIRQVHQGFAASSCCCCSCSCARRRGDARCERLWQVVQIGCGTQVPCTSDQIIRVAGRPSLGMLRVEWLQVDGSVARGEYLLPTHYLPITYSHPYIHPWNTECDRKDVYVTYVA